MRRAVIIFLLAGLTPFAPLRGSARGEQRPEELVRTIVEVWRARQAEVQTLTCEAAVDTFYPKGYVSGVWLVDQALPPDQANRLAKTVADIPEQEARFTDESYSWAFDFLNQRIRKEYQVTNDWYGPEHKDCYLAPSYSLRLFTDGKFTEFRRYPERKTDALRPDVNVYGGRAIEFLLDFTDLPLFWTAGGVSGEFPLPSRMKYLESPPRFTYRGEAKWKGKDCVILTTLEQNNPTTVREFWVGRDEPYPIHFCRARGGERINWQIDVEHRRDARQRLVPTRWTYTGYYLLDPTNRLFYSRTFRVRQFQINPTLPAELFQKSLEPGMVVRDVEKNKNLQVMDDGSLGPYRRSPDAGERWVGRVALWLGGAFFVFLSVVVVLWYRRRRLSVKSI